jgi:hypothetical protein
MIKIRESFTFFFIVQVIVFITTFSGFYLKLDKKHKALSDILALETYVSTIEGVAYMWIWYHIDDIKNMAKKRYLDWVITTLLLLVSSVVYFKYEKSKENNFKEQITLSNVWETDKKIIQEMFLYNLLMLGFGFAGEMGIIPKYYSVPIGFVFFGLLFNLIYKQYCSVSNVGRQIFPIYLIVWGLYGVCAVLGDVPKNIGYNILDLVSKSFLGLYIFYLAYKLRKR